MDGAFITRIDASFRLLAPRGPEMVDRFYARMFAGHPEMRSMFPANMRDQKSKLLALLVLVVRNLRSPHTLRATLLGLGARHNDYGVEPQHYPILRDALVSVMGEMSGNAWSDQLANDWRNAVDFVAVAMMEGQAAHAATLASRTLPNGP